MSVLRPDPAEYIEDFGCGQVRSMDYLLAALQMATEAGLTTKTLAEIAESANSVREFEMRVEDVLRERAA